MYSKIFNKIYIGFTSNLEQRMLSHNVLAKKGYTLKYIPWDVVYTEIFETKLEAIQRAKQLKSGKGREFMWALIKDIG